MPREMLQVRDPEELFGADWGPAGDAESACVWLAGRVRMRTPRGATEFLTMRRGEYAARVAAGLKILSLYERLFPGEYAGSTRPPFTTERETEFYHLVNQHKFPVDLSPCYKHPNWVYLWIPVRNQLRHDFIVGCGCPFEQWETVFQLVIALCNTFKREDWWPRLARRYGLPESPRPRAWTEVSIERFTEICFGDPAYRMLPLAFLVAAYKTGNLFLDAHPYNPTYRALNARFEWNEENVEILAAEWRKARQLLTNVMAMSLWLKADPARRLARAVEYWNQAAGEWEF